MTKTGILFALGFLCWGTVALASGSINMKEGLWEITSTVEMPGMMSLPPTSYTQCITKEDLIPQNKQPNQECTMTDIKQEGDSVSWTLRCSTPGGAMEGKGNITYKGETFSGGMQTTMSGQFKMQINTRMEGKRISDCP